MSRWIARRVRILYVGGKNMRNGRKKLFTAVICICMVCIWGNIFGGTGIFVRADTVDSTETGAQTDPVLDMTTVTLQNTSVTAYLVPTYSDGKSTYYNYAEADIIVNSAVVLDEKDGIDLTCKSSGKKVQVYASLSQNVLHLKLYGNKKCSTKLTIGIAGKSFKVNVNLKPVKISNQSLLLERGKTKKLKIVGCSKGVKWSSSNKKIATVSKTGVVKGKKIGNVVITAKIGSKSVGCAVSVTTGTLKRVCERATYIGTNWSYSQAKRTQAGFYDCSSLVWKAYMECAGFSFGNANYPGTSATEAAWCNANGRMIKGGYSYKKVKKMQLNPGDIVFKSTDAGNPYNTTYHVEMFTGYICTGYDSKGKPLVSALWAARSIGYGAAEGSLLARPLRY